MTTMMTIMGRTSIVIILPILLTLSTPTILAIPESGRVKTMKDLDISGPNSRMVAVIPSTEFPGGTHYTIKKASMGSYVIGMVRDDQDVIMEGDPTAMSRYILVHPREDGMRYIRIMTRKRKAHKYVADIDEFVKRPEDAHYAPIIRTPVDLNILSMDNTQYMDIEVMSGPTWTGEGHPSLPTRYSIKPEFWLTHMIGVVRYGHHIVDDGIHGLMSREVIWEGMIGEPIITIISRYTDGRWTEAKYMLTGNGGIRMVDGKSKIVDLHE